MINYISSRSRSINITCIFLFFIQINIFWTCWLNIEKLPKSLAGALRYSPLPVHKPSEGRLLKNWNGHEGEEGAAQFIPWVSFLILVLGGYYALLKCNVVWGQNVIKALWIQAEQPLFSGMFIIFLDSVHATQWQKAETAPGMVKRKSNQILFLQI